MCGGTIIADFISLDGRRRVTASDIWPDSPFAKFDPDTFFDCNPTPVNRTDSIPRKLSQPISGDVQEEKLAKRQRLMMCKKRRQLRGRGR